MRTRTRTRGSRSSLILCALCFLLYTVSLSRRTALGAARRRSRNHRSRAHLRAPACCARARRRDDARCTVCHEGDEETSVLLICDHCNMQGCHLHCHTPVLTEVPDEETHFFCSECINNGHGPEICPECYTELDY